MTTLICWLSVLSRGYTAAVFIVAEAGLDYSINL